MKAAIVIDNWKLQVFTKHLLDADYVYHGPEPFSLDTSLLTVHYASIEHLRSILLAAAEECRKI